MQPPHASARFCVAASSAIVTARAVRLMARQVVDMPPY